MITARDRYHHSHSWRTRVRIIAFYHGAMMLKREQWNMRLTARYFNISLGAVSEAVLLANYLPIISKVKTRTKALYILRSNGVTKK